MNIKNINKKIKEKKKMAKRDKMLIACIFSITIYTITSFVLQFFTSVEISSTLTTAFFGFWGLEVWQLARITINKNKNGEEE